jgi:hypothetical protein
VQIVEIIRKAFETAAELGVAETETNFPALHIGPGAQVRISNIEWSDVKTDGSHVVPLRQFEESLENPEE